MYDTNSFNYLVSKITSYLQLFNTGSKRTSDPNRDRFNSMRIDQTHILLIFFHLTKKIVIQEIKLFFVYIIKDNLCDSLLF